MSVPVLDRNTPAGIVGNTPVLWIDELSRTSSSGFWAKLESANPGGGMKDRAALHMIGRALDDFLCDREADIRVLRDAGLVVRDCNDGYVVFPAERQDGFQLLLFAGN